MKLRDEQISPFVYWAQDKTNIFIKIDLKDVKDDRVWNITDDSITLDTFGVGAHGPANYSVHLKLYNTIQQLEDGDKDYLKVTDQGLQLTLTKQECQWWPRLLQSTLKPPWLKIDFERLKSDDDDDEDLAQNDGNRSSKDVPGDCPELSKRLTTEQYNRRMGQIKLYMVLYNIGQLLVFIYISVVITVRYAKYGPDSMKGTYSAVGDVLKPSLILQFLEILHPMVGYTRGSIFMSFIQVTGRAIVLFAMIDAEPRMQTKPVIFYLVINWTFVEVIRYLYYIAKLYKVNVYLITWLRYSMWIPLYPFGILCEGIIILRNIPYFEETGKFSISMPNKWNCTFHCPSAMKIYLLVLFVPGMYTMMSHMYKARMKKLAYNREQKKAK